MGLREDTDSLEIAIDMGLGHEWMYGKMTLEQLEKLRARHAYEKFGNYAFQPRSELE